MKKIVLSESELSDSISEAYCTQCFESVDSSVEPDYDSEIECHNCEKVTRAVGHHWLLFEFDNALEII